MAEIAFQGSPAMHYFESALAGLHEAAGLDETTIVRDALIRRFVNAFETAWRALFWSLTLLGVQVRSETTDVLQRSGETGLLKDEALWREIRYFRDRSPQAFDETIAGELADFVRAQAIIAFDDLLLEIQASIRLA